MVIKVPGRKKGPKHSYDFVESITRIEFPPPCKNGVARIEGPISIARVWREKDDIEPSDLEDMDLFAAVEDMHPVYIREIAVKLAELPRVTAVEVTRAGDGKGIVIYRQWP